MQNNVPHLFLTQCLNKTNFGNYSYSGIGSQLSAIYYSAIGYQLFSYSLFCYSLFCYSLFCYSLFTQKPSTPFWRILWPFVCGKVQKQNYLRSCHSFLRRRLRQLQYSRLLGLSPPMQHQRLHQ